MVRSRTRRCRVTSLGRSPLSYFVGSAVRTNSCRINSAGPHSGLTLRQKVETVASTRADHDLLFEALAIHLGFVTRSSMDEALKIAAVDDSGTSSVAAILSQRADLSAEHAAVLELLVNDMLARHGGNVRRCLHSLTAFGRLRHDLERRLAGLESRHPTVPPRANASGGQSNRQVRHSNGAAAPGVAASGPPIDQVPADADARNADADPEADTEQDEREYEWSLAAPKAVGNRFQIMHPHARGGIGVVSVAFDSELQREVALKQIKTDSADDPDSRSRFLLEAEVTGRLEHPGVVPVYGLGYDEQGRPYYAMRFVRGITLEDAVAKFHAAAAGHAIGSRERALELRQLLGRFVNVCHTMAYAHSRGVLHRDLKPANVLLGPYNETLIVDWGLAKVLRGGRIHRSRRPGSPWTTSNVAGRPGRAGSFHRWGIAARRRPSPARRSAPRPS